MAKVINMFSPADDGMKEYHQKIWKHRRNVILRYLLLMGIIVLLVFGIRYYLNNRTFTGYVVSASAKRTDTLMTKYEQFGGDILKYSRDGLSYMDEKNSLYFSITYTMQDPILALSGKSGAVADKNGSQIYIFDRTQQKGEIKTLLPIKNIAISEQGVVAVLLENNAKSTKLEIYSADGKTLGEGEFDLADAGAPLDLSISADGTKIAVTFAQVDGTHFGSCVAVYNFDNVGQNYVDHLVFAKTYSEYMMPEVHYFNDSVFSATGDGIVAFYEGGQIPEETAKIEFEERIRSVFYGEKAEGLVFEGENGYLFRLYDTKGNSLSEFAFDMDYDNIRITDRSVIVYSDTRMEIYNYAGKKYFEQDFETPLLEIFPAGARNRYLFIYTNETQSIKLQ